MKIKIFCCITMMLAAMLMPLPAYALADADAIDYPVLGLELEKILNLGSGLLATFLFILTFMAYRRQPKTRLLLVAAAFLLFAAKGYLTSAEMFTGEISWIDPVASVLNFGILLCFFYGVMKR